MIESLVHVLLLSLCVATSCYQVLALTPDNNNDNGEGRFPIQMPQIHPYRNELYLCTPIKVDYTKSYYIVGFEPNATMNTAHHMLLYGCGEPGDKRAVWDCGEMASSDNMMAHSITPCGRGSTSQIIYAWARDAPKLTLPTDVGFKVGADSPVKYIVLQVHYAHKFPEAKTDDSGVIMHYTEKQMKKMAGILLLGTAGLIPPNSVEHMDSSCAVDKEIFPFAYRTHTHQLGKVVAGYRVRTGLDGRKQWVQLGKRDPLTPQMFYPIENSEAIQPGDILASRCTMESHRSRVTYTGPTNDDEMCNFYVMYWSNSEPLEKKYCFTNGPPTYRWSSDPDLNNIPEIASTQL